MNLYKDFDRWNEVKKETDINHRPLFYHEREVWWCTFGINIGHEQNGKGNKYRRPALILKGLGKHTCIILPLTTSKHIHLFRFSAGTIAGKQAQITLSQISTIDTKRLVRKMGYLRKDLFVDIRSAVRSMF